MLASIVCRTYATGTRSPVFPDFAKIELVCQISHLAPRSIGLLVVESTRSQAEPGNADPEALPPFFRQGKRGRASRYRLRGSACEPVISNLSTQSFEANRLLSRLVPNIDRITHSKLLLQQSLHY